MIMIIIIIIIKMVIHAAMKGISLSVLMAGWTCAQQLLIQSYSSQVRLLTPAINNTLQLVCWIWGNTWLVVNL